uniref:Ig-like domain-containing protein n=1 Tax=Leptobrachium leishanense TaxID=445787 RepID=A0A8C5M6Y7_9ANUR
MQILSLYQLHKTAIKLHESDPGTVRPSEQLRLTCTVSGTELSSIGIHWTRQPPGKGLEWIAAVWSAGSIYIADSFKRRVSISKDNAKKQAYLQMNTMEVKDNGVYYCSSSTETETVTISQPLSG